MVPGNKIQGWPAVERDVMNPPVRPRCRLFTFSFNKFSSSSSFSSPHFYLCLLSLRNGPEAKEKTSPSFVNDYFLKTRKGLSHLSCDVKTLSIAKSRKTFCDFSIFVAIFFYGSFVYLPSLLNS